MGVRSHPAGPEARVTAGSGNSPDTQKRIFITLRNVFAAQADT
jgi:hypothetical protein